MEASRRDLEADLRRVQRDGHSRARTPAPATSPVYASTPEGRSTETTGASAALICLDRARSVRPRLAVEAGAEERVDDDVRLLDGASSAVRAALPARQHLERDPRRRRRSRRRRRRRRTTARPGSGAAPPPRRRARPAPSARARRAPPPPPSSPPPCRAARASGVGRRRRPPRPAPRVRHREIDLAGADPLGPRLRPARERHAAASAGRRSRSRARRSATPKPSALPTASLPAKRAA